VASNYHSLPALLDRRSGRPADGRIVFATLLVGSAVCLLATGLAAQRPAIAVVWESVALATYCVGLLILAAAAAGHEGLGLASWKIGPWSLAWAAVAFGLATITWRTPQVSDAAQITLPNVMKALWLIALGMTAYTVGYCIGSPRMAERQAGRLPNWLSLRYGEDIRSPWVPWMLFAVGSAAQIISAITSGRFGYVGNVAAATTAASGYGQFLAIAAACGPLSVAAAAMLYYRSKAPASRLVLIILAVTEIVIGAASGFKGGYLVVILAVLIPRAAAKRRLPPAVIAATILIFLLIIIPFNVKYRQIARGSATLSTGQAMAAAPGILEQVLLADKSLSVLSSSTIAVAERIREIDSPAIIIQRTPSQIPYSSTAQLAIAPAVDLIPRALWPGKPILATGYEFSQQYFGLPPDIYTSSAITPEGDLYRHGGWPPVIVGMFALGCGIRVLDTLLDVRTSAHSVFLVIMLFPQLVNAEDDWISLLAGIPGWIILWIVVVRLSFRRNFVAAATTE
jgi:hypothetical protein